jgi:hypothetical protein
VARRPILFALKAFQTRPRFQQRTIHGEMLVGSQTFSPRLLHHPRQKLLGYVGLQQAPVSRSHLFDAFVGNPRALEFADIDNLSGVVAVVGANVADGCGPLC